jgi:hypothetical protein
MEKSILHTSLVAASTVNMWVLHPESALRNTEVKLQKVCMCNDYLMRLLPNHNSIILSYFIYNLDIKNIFVL